MWHFVITLVLNTRSHSLPRFRNGYHRGSISKFKIKKEKFGIYFHFMSNFRVTFPWKYRDEDFDIMKQPAAPEYIGTIQLHGGAREQEMREANEKEKHEWQSRLAVDDVRFRTHRCLPGTELTDKGRKASNSLAKIEDVLKDSPKKYSLRKRELKLDKMPALSTVSGGGLSGRGTSGGEKRGGFNPGPFEERSWLKEENRIPMRRDGLERSGGGNGEDFR